jgi:hypothetical protein
MSEFERFFKSPSLYQFTARHTHARTHARTHMHAHVRMHTYVITRTYAHARTHTHAPEVPAGLHHVPELHLRRRRVRRQTLRPLHPSVVHHLHTYVHTCMHTYINAYMHTCIHTYIHTYTMHTYIHTYMHAYMHACMHAYICHRTIFSDPRRYPPAAPACRTSPVFAPSGYSLSLPSLSLPSL